MESEQNAVRRLLVEIKELRDEIEAANRCHEELTEALQLRDAEIANLKAQVKALREALVKRHPEETCKCNCHSDCPIGTYDCRNGCVFCKTQEVEE